ncbi:Trypsin [Pleurocapsa sp. PCC 7327]|uniref:trypsin-like serine protease n=1 Tax=Pleurocapsa sp. PCC 7327 TaxID=118163 RepID=UPI00029F994C|nr:trypsin-like serine protease [Pleurocapsa sp. PCC 7327]AFY76984.1 Trypsin [Pleurocapsa sp. PCC 7327]
MTDARMPPVRCAIAFLGLLTCLGSGSQAAAANLNLKTSPVQRRIATVSHPDDYITSVFNGVARLAGQESNRHSCAGSLLKTGLHLLTAGHCVFEFKPQDFVLDFGEIKLSAAQFFIHPEYEHSIVANDIAIIELITKAPQQLTRYDIYRDNNEIGKVFNLVGYGAFGTGDRGAGLSLADFDYQKRLGKNTYDASGELLNGLIPDFPILPGTLAYDFDNGRPENDAFGVVFGSQYANLGLGLKEVNSALGDSGSPNFIDGLIAGITSYGFGANYSDRLLSTDLTPTRTDSSFGEFSVDTRVSFYARWIDSVLQNNNSVSIPEPSPLTGLAIVSAGFLLKRNKYRHD